MSRRLSVAIVAVVVTAAAHGCTQAPPPAVPVAQADLSAALDRLALCDTDGLRGSGRGEASVSGRRLSFAYAFVYSRPGWLRADIRPHGPMMPGRLTTLFLLERATVRAFLPDRMLEIGGSVHDLAVGVPWTDNAAVAIGASDARFLADLSNPTLARDANSLIVRGSYADRTVIAEFAESPPRLLSLEVRGPEGTLSVRYSGHGWKSLPWLPRVVEMEISESGHKTFSVTLRHEAARGMSDVERADYTFDVPEGTTVIDWRELDPGRTE